MLRARLLWLSFALPAVYAGCGSSSGAGPEPEVSLASSAAAQSEFRELRQQWAATPLDARTKLERPLTQFVQAHPMDPQGRLARIYLAWISIQRGELDVAERWLALAEPGSAGSAADLLGVVSASLLLSRGHAERAYRSLLALESRLIDTDDRLLCLDQLVLAALASAHYREATLHILDLAAQAARRHRERTWRTLEARLPAIPLPVLEESLGKLSEASVTGASVRPAERAAAVDWMRRHILELLARSALEQRDVGLAQRLVAAPTSHGSSEQEKAELLLLATQGGRSPAVFGRTLGLALEMSDADGRQRALDVTSGIAVTLDLAETGNAERVRLVTREVDQDGMAEALARLAADGAALIAAGFDPKSASLAAAYAREHGVPVLLLHEPEASQAPLPENAYVVGADEEAAHAVLRAALSRRGVDVIAVGSPDFPCDASAANRAAGSVERSMAGSGRLALAFQGSAHCARGVLMGLGAHQASLIGLGLGALTALARDIPADELWTLEVGRLPRFEGAREPALIRWLESRGRAPGWHEALGHDVALLADVALPRDLPSAIRDAAAVSSAYARVASLLERVEVTDLWTSSAPRFDASRRLPREFRASKLRPARPGAPR